MRADATNSPREFPLKRFSRRIEANRYRVSPFIFESAVGQHGEGANMCDQDHFDDDLKEFEAGGMVTRRQFGVLLGAGVMMMLPKVLDAVAVTESGVTIKTPDGTCDAYFVHPATGTAPAVLLWLA